MRKASSDVINLSREAAGNQQYDNRPVAQVNDHVIRIATMTEPYHWHRHPDSDESFLALEGGLYIDLDDRTVELQPGTMFTVLRGVRHRRRPMSVRSVNLTFERANAKSETLAAPTESLGLRSVPECRHGDWNLGAGSLGQLALPWVFVGINLENCA